MSTSVVNSGVVLVDAGRSAVIPDGPGLPETPAQILEGVIGALLHRSGIELADVDELYLADPRYLPSVPSPDSNVIESGGGGSSSGRSVCAPT